MRRHPSRSDADLDALQAKLDAQETVDQAKPLAPLAKSKARRRWRSGAMGSGVSPASVERLMQAGRARAQSP